jgi:hypothetical protein
LWLGSRLRGNDAQSETGRQSFNVECWKFDVQTRRGYLYVAVMVTATLVGLVGLSAVSVARLNLRTTTRTADSSSADFLAQSAVEHALAVLKNDPAWRTTYQDNTEYPGTPISMNGGTVTWKLIDADGSLLDDDSDTVRIYGIGRQGSATSVQSVQLYPTENPLSCTGAAFHCAGSITVGFTANFDTNKSISSNGSIAATAFGASIGGNAYAAGAITGNVSGTSTSGATPRRLPGSSVFDFYKARGTWINVASLPVVSGKPTIEKAVISPGSNPWGTVNSAGIYVIDCQNQSVTIKNSRIHGTLVLLNAGANSSIEGSVHWDAVVKNLPALLVQGNLKFGYHDSALDEATLSRNFNPAGSPYEGDSDSDTTDTYPSRIYGLVYVSGHLNLPADSLDSDVTGCVVCTTSAASSDAEFTHDVTFQNFPPPGFASGNVMEIIAGTWRRDVLP